MFRKTSQYLFKKPDEIGFDNYLVLVLSFLTASLALLGTIINIFLGLGGFAIISTLVPTLIFIPIYLYSRITREYIISKYVLIILSLIILNFQWIINFGSTGPSLYLFVVLESFIIIFFKKWEQFIFSLIVFVNVSILFYIEYSHPLIFGKYLSDSVRLIDVYLGMLIYLFLSIFMLKVALKFYINEREKAQIADKLKSAFLANMSHEIRTPMNGILGFANLLKKPNLSEEVQNKYLSIIESSGQRMLHIINDIVDISKIEAGLMEMDKTAFGLNELTNYIYNFFKPEIDAKGMQLSVKNALSDNDSNIISDQDKVYAILSNLVKNAIKYTDNGSVEFGYNLVSTGGDAGSLPAEIQFYVIDTGIGVPSDKLNAIFERFVQADISDKMARQGAGLGLAITKAYVEMLGGKIWVKSEEGKGSAFYFTIPYIKNVGGFQPVENHPEDSPVEHQISNLKILIAEDDEISELLIHLLAEQFSGEILKVKSGPEAVKVCRDNPDIDLILMDIQMPGMDGYEASKQIREFNKNVVIIAQTAFGFFDDKQKAFEAGCNDFISKPISNSLFKELIYKHFRKQ